MSAPLDRVAVEKEFASRVSRGIDTSEKEVFAEMLLAEVQFMFDGALEGHYWAVQWGTPDKVIEVMDVLGNKIDEVVPTGFLFSKDFVVSSANLLRDIDTQVKKVVARH